MTEVNQIKQTDVNKILQLLQSINETQYRDPTEISPKQPEYNPNEVPSLVKNYTTQTREKMFGKDTREAMARAAEITAIIADGAKVSADVATEITQSLLDGAFDTAGIEQNFEQRLNDAIANLQPEWTQFKEDTNEQLTHVEEKLEELTSDYDVTVTVGSGGDYESINEAIEFLSRKRFRYKLNGLKAEIKLLTGFNMTEQVLVRGIDLGFITITAEDEEVTIIRSFLIESFSVTDNTVYPAFGAADNGVLPIIDVKFVMSYSGDALNRHGVFVADGARSVIRPEAGVINSGGVGLYAFNGAHIVAFGSVFDGANSACLLAFRGSYINFRNGSGKNSNGNGVYLGSSSVVEAMHADFSGARGHAAWVYAGGRLNIRHGNLSGAGERAIHAHFNSQVSAASSNLSGARGRGASATQASTIDLDSAIIEDCGSQGIYADGASTVNADGVTVKRCGNNAGVYAATGATVNVSNGLITDNILHGIYANRGGRINADDADCSGNGQARDIRIDRGSIISAYNALGSVGAQLENEVTSAGIIFR
ncbi:right-handed parallel beta-helix repeat-containing protein [Alkalihalobacillus trypoxylicola]|uniref:Right handed beta helix domain-containing protein n=1 Tax=Alkalihalobacillus trypoxylicola TaxID=519424 RepID=A0A161PZL1_9BACI|nr:right-handed parallel beta-helix repeat-containing protein [Alkalihalobacillus trypoxylicola]KYG28185.1 hypothetical protein AZF04_09795 [Alkalihalobacillus trypoxylicola]